MDMGLRAARGPAIGWGGGVAAAARLTGHVLQGCWGVSWVTDGSRAEETLVLSGGTVVDVFASAVYPGDVVWCGATIVDVIRGGNRAAPAAHQVLDVSGCYILPGLINGHLHVESSLVTPGEYAAAVLRRGTTSLVADPHEIANVLGVAGVRYMLDSGGGCDFFYCAPSCVPATPLETAGASIGAAGIEELLTDRRVVALGEMMNFPGVLGGDPEVLAKLGAARRAGKPVDGHAPGLGGADLARYAAAGISSEHEATTLAEAEEKLGCGMWIMVREGSAARNLAALAPLAVRQRGERMMLVTDDRHPDDLLAAGEMDHVLRSAVGRGISPVDAIRMATLNPATYFGLRDRGLVAPGRIADLWVVEDLESFSTRMVIKSGRAVAACETHDAGTAVSTANTVKLSERSLGALDLAPRRGRARVIAVVPGQIVTRGLLGDVEVVADGRVRSGDVADIARLAVLERHGRTEGGAGLGFISGIGLRTGAIASTVAHDSHNVIVAGTNTADMRFAAGHLAALGGGFVAVRDGRVLGALALAVAGLMSDRPVGEVAAALHSVNAAARSLGCSLDSPFMTLSFMALPVIPELKLTDRGLVDVGAFRHVPVWV